MGRILNYAALACAGFALSACELRQDGENDGTDTDVIDPAATLSPTATASPVTSIIRDDVAEPVDETELPTQPVELTIPFPESGSLSARAERMLVGVMDKAAMNESWPIVLAGHTDSSGNDAANLRASRSRAETVAAWLVERGVDDERIEVIAFGEQNPVAPNALPDGEPNEEGRRRNRRVELRIAPPANTPAVDDSEEDSDETA